MRYNVDHSLFSLRPVFSDDHEWLVDLHNDPEVLHNLTHSAPITLARHLSWWDSIRSNPKQLRLIFEVGGERAGFTKFYDIDHGNRNCVLGADIHKEFRGKGYAKSMWTLMLERCFNQLNMHRVGLTTAEYNHIARLAYTKLGFKSEGVLSESLWRDGKFHDQVVMRLLRPEWEAMERQQ